MPRPASALTRCAAVLPLQAKEMLPAEGGWGCVAA